MRLVHHSTNSVTLSQKLCYLYTIMGLYPSLYQLGQLVELHSIILLSKLQELHTIILFSTLKLMSLQSQNDEKDLFKLKPKSI